MSNLEDDYNIDTTDFDISNNHTPDNIFGDNLDFGFGDHPTGSSAGGSGIGIGIGGNGQGSYEHGLGQQPMKEGSGDSGMSLGMGSSGSRRDSGEWQSALISTAKLDKDLAQQQWQHQQQHQQFQQQQMSTSMSNMSNASGMSFQGTTSGLPYGGGGMDFGGFETDQHFDAGSGNMYAQNGRQHEQQQYQQQQWHPGPSLSPAPGSSHAFAHSPSPVPVGSPGNGMGFFAQAQMQAQVQARSAGAHELFGGAAPHSAAPPPQTSASATFGLTAHTPYAAGATPEPDAWAMDGGDGGGGGAASGPGMNAEEFDKLIESLSNNGSRAPSPINFPTSHTDGSLHSSHPETPFSTHIPSPSFSPLPRPGSSASNHSGIGIHINSSGASPSGFNKPQSPPALVMPTNNAPSPSPALPPIITQPAAPASGSGGQGHALTGQIGGMGGLLPPTNPALEHLSGMMGISPIAPNADGPQIFVQPSTPISGLKDGRGHFDAVLRKMGLQNAQQQHSGGGGGQGQQGGGLGQQGGDGLQRSRSPSVSAASVSGESTGHYGVTPPNANLSGAHSNAHAAQAAAHAQARMQLQNDMEWEDLASSSRLGADGTGNGFGATTRPRAKSDSHMPLAEADRQAMFSYLARAQLSGVAPDQAVMDSMAPDQRSQIDAWLSSMTMNSPGMGYAQLQQQQQAAGQINDNRPTTMNPNQLPGNDDNIARAISPGLASASATIAKSAPPTAQMSFSTPAEELRAKHMQQQRQLELIQAQQRHKLSLNTSLGSQATVSNNGILKYEPGEFSPTSLAFYQQQGLFPVVGTNAAPLPGGMGLFAAAAGGSASAGLDGTFANMATFNPAHISTTASAPYYQTHFPAGSAGAGGAAFPSAALGSMGGAFPHTAAPGSSFLSAGNNDASLPRRRSFAEGSHPAAGAGTPGYGAALQRPSPLYAAGTGGGPGTLSPFGTLDPGRLRGVGAQSAQGHRRAARSEDFGRGGWGVGQGGSTADFLNSITGNDGSLIPPLRGRTMSHGRQSSASSVRSASPALSISSQGSSMSAYHGGGGAGYNRMDMPEGQSVPMPMGHPSHSRSNSNTSVHGGAGRLAKMKVTSMATEVAATSRRTNDGVFHCPVPGCGSTFTRHFNLKGHMRSHNDERPFKCLYDGCPKAEIGFARQHDCKRHMLLHKGLRPFECDACGKKFARLDALTRHHKSEQGQECAITHPLPVNPDGSAMSESQYKAYKAHEAQIQGLLHPDGSVKQEDDDMGGKKGKGRRKSATGRNHLSASNSASGMSGDEDMGGGASGMEDYDRF